MKESRERDEGRGRGGRRKWIYLSSAASVWLAACSGLSGPEYKRPEVETPTAWSTAPETQVSAEDTIRPDWWTGFGDPYLNGLVKNAVANSSNLRMAVARLDAAGTALGEQQAGLLPTLSAGTSAARGESVGEFGPGPVETQYESNRSLNWELDVWGKVRKGIAAEQANYRASEADWRATYLTTVAAAANTYFRIRQLDEQIDLQRDAQDTNTTILAIYQGQLREGMVPKTQVLRQKAEVNNIRRTLLDLQRQRKIAENGLATLMGVPVGELKVPVAHLRDTIKPMDVPIGLPSSLLSRRPDIIAAEYRVLAAHELVGQARLARLPTLSLTGQGGTQGGGAASTALTALVKGLTLGLGPSINIPIFDPTLKAQLKSSESRVRLSEEQYRRTVIKAFEEVENALVNLASRKQQKKELEAQVRNLRIVADQVHAQLEAGMVSQLQVFESERRVLQAGQALLTNYQQIVSETLGLYKALGGGWPEEMIDADLISDAEPSGQDI